MRRWLPLAWVTLAGFSLAVGLGNHHLIDPDEGRNASIGLEMATTGDLLLPRLNDLPFLDKPPLFFMAEAFSIGIFGASEFAARLPSLLFAWGTVALTAWFGAFLFGRGTAWIAGLACATSPLAIAMARTAIFDSMLSFFIVLAVIAFYRAIEEGETPVRHERFPRWNLLAWGAMALGMLTKGPVAVVIPLLIVVPFALWRRRSRAVWHVAGGGLHLAIVVPWVLAVEHRVPGFVHYALVTETWQRFTTDELHRTGPVWYFLPFLLAGSFPWILMVLSAGIGRWKKVLPAHRPALVFLALWVLLPLAFFSLSQSKRPQYILPLVPAVALLAAWLWSGHRAPRLGIRVAAVAWGVLGALFLLVMDGPGNGDPGAIADTTLWRLFALAVLAAILAWVWSDNRVLAPVALTPDLLTYPPSEMSG